MAVGVVKGHDIDWESSDTHMLFNPHMHPTIHAESVLRQLPAFSGHIWISTSGTTQARMLRLVALSKRAFLISAQAVNDHLRVTAKDRWLNTLPLYHVGGLAIYARSHLIGQRVESAEMEKWDPLHFVRRVEETGVSLTSLVPTQVFDIVTAKVSAPRSLRAVIVGGGALSQTLYRRARELSWPILPSYGMTETCSQVATAPLSSLESLDEPPLVRLNHVKWHTNGEGRLMLSSGALLSAYAFLREERTEIFDPKDGGWFVTEDLAELNGDRIELKGRKDDRIKVSGELVDIFQLNRKFQSLLHHGDSHIDVQLIASPNSRLGHQIDLVSTLSGFNSIPPLVNTFNLGVSGVERIRNIYFVEKMPAGAIGKIQVQSLLEMLGIRSA